MFDALPSTPQGFMVMATTIGVILYGGLWLGAKLLSRLLRVPTTKDPQ